jgi:hypothetical protein
MSMSFRIKVLAGAVAMALAGAAMANTSLDALATGDLFLNIVDTTNNTSFLFDTGTAQAAFTGTSNASYNLATDPNLKTFLNGTDTFDYSVISGTKNPATTIDFTGGANATFPTPLTPTAFTLNQALSPVTTFLAFANTVASSTTNSAVIPTGTANQAFWGAALNEGVLSAKLFNAPNTPYADNAALGTPLSFFQAVGSTVTTFAGQWNFSAATDMLSYTVSGGGGGPPPPPVPLPSALLLLLSGLGLMGSRAFMSRARSAV